MTAFIIYSTLSYILSGNLTGFSKVVANPDAITGTWPVQDSSSKVKIEKLDGKFVGRIVWLREPADKYGKPKLDAKNPDKAKQSRSIICLRLLNNFVFDSDNVWSGGDIYDPKSGNTYSCKITLKDYNTMEIRGYIGISLFGRTEIWHRCL